MSELPIPNDWAEEDGWIMMTLCVPNSERWLGIARGKIYELTRGRKWNEKTGSIVDAQDIGWRIYDSLMQCNDLTKSVRMLVAAIVGEQVDLTDEAAVLPDSINYTVNGLVPTLLGLQLSPVTNVAAPTVNVDCGGGCGCEPGTEAPPTGGIEGDPPPTGWGEPTDPDTGEPVPPGSSAYQSRKCKAANLLHDGIRELINQLSIYGVETIASLGLGTASVVVAGILGTIGGPVGLIVGILGALPVILLAYIVESVNASVLLGLLDTYQEDLVCALYNSQSADQAIADYGQVLTDAGANSSQTTLIWAILTYATANALFFKKDGAEGDQVEQDIEDYVGGVNCAACGCGGVTGVTDSFTDADATNLTAHVPDIGDNSWINDVGTWTIASNQARSNGAVGSRAVYNTCLADCTITCDVSLDTTSGNDTAFQGLIFRWSDKNNHLIFTYDNGFDSGTERLRVSKIENGTRTDIATLDISLSGTLEFKVVLLGDSIKCYTASTLRFDVTDAFNQTAQYHGIRSGQSTVVRFDNFDVGV